MFFISQSSQLFFRSLMYLTATMTIFTHLITFTVATNAQSKDLEKLKQEASVGDNKNVIQSSNIGFNLQKCQRIAQSKTVTCLLLFTATSQEQERISIFGGNKYGSSRVFDLSGNEYTANFARIGKAKSTDNSFNGEVVNELIPGIPTKVTINFELPPDLTKLAAFEIKFNNIGKAVFRDVNIVTTGNTLKK